MSSPSLPLMVQSFGVYLLMLSVTGWRWHVSSPQLHDLWPQRSLQDLAWPLSLSLLFQVSQSRRRHTHVSSTFCFCPKFSEELEFAYVSGCCSPSSISQCLHGQQWSYFQPVVVGFGTSPPPVCAECVLMREVTNKLMNSGFPSHKSLETPPPRNLVRRISYILLPSCSGSFLEEFLENPDFFSASLSFSFPLAHRWACFVLLSVEQIYWGG